MTIRIIFLILAALATGVSVTNCTPSTPNALDSLGTVDMTIKGQAFRLWIADNDAERARGLMFVTLEQMAPFPDGTKRGMIFIFDHELPLTFWMKNTIIPLDIAYLDSVGEVQAKYTMTPLDTRPGQYPSRHPARIAIEVNGNVFSDLDVREGDLFEIPTDLLKTTP